MTADSSDYVLEDIKATRIAADGIDATFRSNSIDLVSAGLEGRVLAFSDQWFAEAANLLNPKAPVAGNGRMVYAGAWYDGWETRRHNTAPFDWVIIRLGVASGTVIGAEIDTAFFSGNEAPAISVEGCFREGGADADAEVVGWGGSRGGWETILGRQPCGPKQRQAWQLDVPQLDRAYTHVRLNMYPDGGIARFRLFGHARPVFPADPAAVFDLAAAQNGAVAVACNNQHFGTKDNLLLPGRGADMADGWETARSRQPGHVDWAVIRLGAPGLVHRFVVDTAFFRGNFPQKVRVEALRWTPGPNDPREPAHDDPAWFIAVPDAKCGPDQEHDFASQLPASQVVTHVKLVLIPDGGVKRLRVFGTRAI
ncbi:allantoicase [Grosmannia clavigera kw1407]|uniref:allantoicase n=1 Tax=Grosmannia clavigera (strain kw1407 / UAMH 11150) TaxID=655863 RepID=F0XTZ7_GROCL|nr:allantoicase [Grosmannia clavigera kw1407]EFW98982.1 allantoicase [Grosmannia clavigera kw1407]